MNRTAKHLKWIAESTFILKLITVVMFFFLIFPALKPIMDGFVKVVLLWGGAQIIYDIFTKRSFLKGRYAFWLLLFLIMEAVSVALNYRTGLKNNLSLLCYTAVAMFVLYPNDENREPMELLREMRIIGFVLIGLCATASAISLLTFVLNYTGTLTYAGTLYHTGVFSGRLWGIYSNPNFPAAIIAAMLSLVQLPLCRAVTKNKKTLPLQYTAALVCLVLNFWYTSLAQARGSLYAFCVFAFVYLYFLFRKKVFASLRSFALACVLSVAIAGLGTAAVWYSEPVILSFSSALPVSVEKTVSSAASSTVTGKTASQGTASKSAPSATQGSNGTVIGRNQDDEAENVLTNRDYIWKSGLAKFVKKPLFGYGNSGGTHGIIVDSMEIKHFHNFVVHSLVTDGLTGTLPLMAFILLSLFTMAGYCIRHRRYSIKSLKNPEIPEIIYGLLALVAFYMANNMVEVFIVFSVSLPNFIFWIYLGYLMSLMTRGQPISRTDRLIRRFCASELASAEEKTV